MQVTSFEDLKKYGEGTIIPLPGFVQDEPFVVRVKRVSLISLIRHGKVPNKLYAAVAKLFNSTQKTEITLDVLKENHELFEILAKDTLLEPTYQQIEDAGLELSDDQLLAIFKFSQKGVTELETFRTESEDNGDHIDGEGVQGKAE